MNRRDQFLMLVQMAAIVADLKQPEPKSRAVWVLSEAFRVAEDCLPTDLESATWEFVDSA